jgi:hypothetical protein
MDEAAVEEEVFPDTPLMPRDTEDHDVFEEHVVKFKSALAGEVAAPSCGLALLSIGVEPCCE